MNFPLIPSRSSHLPFRGKTDLQPQPSPETSPVPQKVSPPTLFIKGFSPIGNTLFIDVEFQEIADRLDLPIGIPRWPDFRLRNAFNQYHNAGQEKQRQQPIVDLYV
ncbi:MAG: hypothetical protein HY787_00925 [Deltaproteobacteria bacterium]|nr:hypothetical protein [Deltaproteobacteria bacterium]